MYFAQSVCVFRIKNTNLWLAFQWISHDNCYECEFFYIHLINIVVPYQLRVNPEVGRNI